MNNWLLLGELSTLFATLCLLGIYVSVYRKKPSRTMVYWIAGWAVMAARFAFGILNELSGPSAVFAVAYHGATALSSLILLRAARTIDERSRADRFGTPAYAAVFLLAGAWILFGTLVLRDPFWIALPTFFFFGSVQIYTGASFLRSARRVSSIGATIAGWAFIVWGLHKLDYPFVRSLPAFAPYGYFLGTFLQMLVGVGFLMLQFEHAEHEARRLLRSLEEKEHILAESEETYRTLVQGLPDAILEFDAQGRHTFASPNVGALLNLDAGRCIGKSHRELGVPEAQCRFWEQAVGAVFARNEPYEDELVLDAAQVGTSYDVRFLPKHRPDGSMDKVIAILRDVTQQKRTFLDLALERERLRSAVKILEYRAENDQELLDFALAEALRLTESGYGYIYLYDEAAQSFTLNSWSGLVMDDCRVADKKTRYALDETGYWGEVVRQRNPIIVNDFHLPSPLHKGYPPGHVEIRRFLSVPIFVGEAIVGVVGVANKREDYGTEDANQLRLLLSPVFSRLDRKSAESRIEAYDALVEAIMESMDDPLVVMDASGRFTNLYGKWFERNRVDTRSFVGRTYEEAFGLQGAPRADSILQQAVFEGRAVHEWTYPVPAGGRSAVFQTVVTPILRDKSLQGFVGVGRDITDLTNAKNDLSRMLTEKIALVQEVQHRVKNNLQLILSLIELQLPDLPEAADSVPLKFLQSRIYALSSAYAAVGRNLSAEFVDLGTQLSTLAELFSQSNPIPQPFYTLRLGAAAPISLRMEVAIPVGLIVHELILEVLLRAENSKDYFEVAIDATLEDQNHCRIAVVRAGAASAASAETAPHQALNPVIAEGLADQIRGTVAIASGDGRVNALVFPIDGAGRLKLPG